MTPPYYTHCPSKPYFHFTFLKRCLLFSLFYLVYDSFWYSISFSANDASSSDFWFDQEVFLNHDISSFLLSNRSKIDWNVKRLHDRMPRLDIQVQFCEIFWQHFFFYFQKTYNFCKQGFPPQMLIFALCEQMFGGRNCWYFRFCFILARFRNYFLKLTAAFL